ncbi:hypothetical protein MKZ08_09850 [Viridibacillus sp. FSL R5-0477]|uniref:Bacterial Ig domain-containing protein n=1 Tax=Viridibacillus arenosi FSL R5-213 TaxID=1227360 RepID=W4F1Q5_9BACL|nr:MULTISPECIES: hypothetical protein [Viridibacillus]ETT86710.1 hypothetical protein C176_08357 [Viridibacillus arenosi FSL R5-213]OMC83479.1 hypothetical protein BK130_08055 [Viridibacillus sp. FSL H8-0123]OMC89520.1 hypothetical protein BK137_17365 [Viridibacillus arenosi]
MKKLYKVLLLIAMLSLVIFCNPREGFAESFSPTIIENEVNAKITFSNRKLTNKPITVTIDTSNSNGGNNYIYDLHNEQSNKAVIQITENGVYNWYIFDKDKELIWGKAKKITIDIKNIDMKKPKITINKPSLEYGTGNYQLNIEVADAESGIKTVIYPNNYKKIIPLEEALSGHSLPFVVYKNGSYKFTAIDFAGNRTEKYIKVKDYKKAKLKINKVTSRSSYIKGYSEKNTWISIYYDYPAGARIAKVKTDSKGKFSAYIGKQKTGTKLLVSTLHIPKKHVSANKRIKVSK